MPDAAPVRMLVSDEEDKWRVCMKYVSEMSTELGNGIARGVGLPSTGVHRRKRHFFNFNTTPTIPNDPRFFQNIAAALGTNNYIIHLCNNLVIDISVDTRKLVLLMYVYTVRTHRHNMCFFVTDTVLVDNHMQFAFDVACQGLDWAIRNLLIPYSPSSANYVFQMQYQGIPAAQAIGKYPICH